VFVTPAGATERTVGTNFAFRTEQNTVTGQDWWGVYVNPSGAGSTTVCNFSVNRPGQAPTISSHPINQTVQAGQPVTFCVDASGTPPLRYQLQKNGINIPGATDRCYTFTPTASDNNASFRCVITNTFGITTSNAALLIIMPGSSCPTATAGGPWQNAS